MLTLEEKACNHETWTHIHRVQHYLNGFIKNLIDRGHIHDQSKLAPPEVEYFAKYTDKLSATTYGSEEYKANMVAMKPAIDHHQANNDHHPEWFFQTEKWKSILNYEDLYEISSFGRVRSLDREVIRENQGNFKKSGQIIGGYVTPHGYIRLQLSKEGKQKNYFIHRLVAEAFIEKIQGKDWVNHKDGDKTNNKISNLEWVTQSENLIHAYDEGLKNGAIKYVVECPQLNLVTFGCCKMEKELRKLGYDRVSSSAIYNCINTPNAKHLDLEFIGSKYEEWMSSPLNEMNLVQIIELIADWKAASERHNDGNIMKSIKINAQKFNIDPQLVRILENTAKLL